MKQTELIMGMPITIEVVGGNESVIKSAFDYFRHVDAGFSTYKNDSEISRFNHGDLPENALSDEVKMILQECDRYKHETQGFFDITRPDGSLDPSGLVKGWSIKGVADLITAAGFNNFFVSAGGDVQTSGRNASGQPWRVGITNPFEPAKFAKQVALSGEAIATSGTYERGAHIYNPHTGQDVTEIVSLSVIGPGIYETDILATAAFVMGKPGLKFLQEHGYEACLISADQTVTLTPGFKRFEVV